MIIITNPPRGGGKKMIKNRKIIYIVKFARAEEVITWHRSIFALLAAILLMTLVVALIGCAEKRLPECQFACGYPPAVVPKMILRDAREESVDPQLFAGRSDWPAVTGDVEFSRFTSYRQYTYDRESLTPGVRDYTFNQFESYRFGTNAR